jgi:Uma2 family endonuclease
MMPEALASVPPKEFRSSPKIKYTVDDLNLMPDDGRKYELIEGELFVSRAAHWNHQLLISNIIVAFGIYLKDNPIGRIVPEPGVIFSDEDAVIPDIVFSTFETIEKNLIASGKFEGKFNAAPDLAIEILSFGKRDIERDQVYKRKIYGKYGVKEYWIVDSRTDSIEVFRLQRKSLNLAKRYRIENEITSPLLPDFKLPLTEVFRF